MGFYYFDQKSLWLPLILLVTLMTGYSAPADVKDGKTKLTSSEIKRLYAGKTAYYPNGEIEYHREDGVTFYKNKNEIVSGKWFTKLNQICYRYYNDYDKIYYHKTFKKGESVTYNGKVITLKMGDTEKLQQAYLSYSLELTSSEIEQLYAGKTAYFQNGETEYHREDGVTFYNSKNKRRIRLGKWFTEKSHICYRYDDDDKTVCQKTFKKGDIVTMYGEVITLKRGDTEELQKSQVNLSRPNTGNFTNTIAYVSPSRGKQSIRLIQADGSNDRLFWSVPKNNLISPAIGTLAWSPDGSELAFDSDHNFGLSSFEREIYVTDGQTTRKIIRPIEAKQNAQYPKGTVKLKMKNGFFKGMYFWAYIEGSSDNHQWIAPKSTSMVVTFNEVADWGENIFQHSILGYIDSRQRRYCYYDLAAMVDVKAGQTVTIPHRYYPFHYSKKTRSCHRVVKPTWNYDGTKLLFTVIHFLSSGSLARHSPDEMYHENFIIALSDTKNIPLDNLAKKVGGFMQNFAHDPKFIKLSPTPEQKVLSVTYHSHADRIYLSSTNDPDLGVTDHMQRINLSGVDRYHITDIEWLPDGNSFMVAMDMRTSHRIYQHNLKTSQTRLLFELKKEYIGDFTISPDGKKIAFERGKRSGGPFAIWVYDTNNRGLAQLVADGAAPAWNSQ